VVVARAGATNMAELAAQGKACVIVPNPVLAGGHQLKNAEAYARVHAVSLVYQSELEADNRVLQQAIVQLLDSKSDRKKFGKRLHAFAHADAAKELAMVLLEQANHKKK
jgi:UDP-N-acetylglucosamine--N-acetylmuramyl-(pentapeptide) pyrophosphoryl-undecaprenol N-acetylglucosamine transferase